MTPKSDSKMVSVDIDEYEAEATVTSAQHGEGSDLSIREAPAVPALLCTTHSPLSHRTRYVSHFLMSIIKFQLLSLTMPTQVPIELVRCDD